MDRWDPKHVELNLSADWNLLIQTTLCILLDYIYIALFNFTNRSIGFLWEVLDFVLKKKSKKNTKIQFH